MKAGRLPASPCRVADQCAPVRTRLAWASCLIWLLLKSITTARQHWYTLCLSCNNTHIHAQIHNQDSGESFHRHHLCRDEWKERESEPAILMHQLSDVCSLSHSHHGVYRRARRNAAATLAPFAPKCYLSHKSPYCRQASITTSTPSKINALMSSSIVIHRATWRPWY